MFDLVIFDCDGVLVDSERLAVPIDVIVLERVGWPLTEAEVIERFVGRSHEYFVSEIEAAIGRSLDPGWEDEFLALYHDAFEADLAPVPGVVDALDRIVTRTCVASGSSHERLRQTLGLTGLHRRFDGRIFSAEDVRNGKPAPDLFLHAAATLGADPERCAVVEDSVFGLEAARAAGMRAFGYAGGLMPAARLAGPATTVFADMRELPALLGHAWHAPTLGPAPSAWAARRRPKGIGARGAMCACPTGAPVLPDRAPAGGFSRAAPGDGLPA